MNTIETHKELAAAGLEGLKKSQEFAWKRAVATGTPFIIWRDGKAVDLNPETNGGCSYAEIKEGETAAVVREEPAED